MTREPYICAIHMAFDCSLPRAKSWDPVVSEQKARTFVCSVLLLFWRRKKRFPHIHSMYLLAFTPEICVYTHALLGRAQRKYEKNLEKKTTTMKPSIIIISSCRPFLARIISAYGLCPSPGGVRFLITTHLMTRSDLFSCLARPLSDPRPHSLPVQIGMYVSCVCIYYVSPHHGRTTGVPFS